VGDAEDKKGESLLSSTPLVVLSTILGRFPTLEEYKDAVAGINLTDFAPPTKELSTEPSVQPVRFASKV
jgi:aconitate hydratase 2/2-methylisocitrate dehydratase